MALIYSRFQLGILERFPHQIPLQTTLLSHPKFVPILYAALVAPIAVMTDIEMTEMIITKVFCVFILSISAGSLLESSKTPL